MQFNEHSFSGEKINKFTDWDLYYSKPSALSNFTRNITIKIILKQIRNLQIQLRSICELGGANSCLYKPIKLAYSDVRYAIMDNNMRGLNLFAEKFSSSSNVDIECIDLLNNQVNHSKQYDLVFSIGLIEHFNPKDTAKIIQRHFELVKENGYVLITFPTPTWLYRVSRSISESLGLWIFHDERPLQMNSVITELSKYGDVKTSFINWLIFFTQGVVVIEACKAGNSASEVHIGSVR